MLRFGLTRRTLLTAALLAGCSRKLAPRFSGRLFTASAGARGIAVADLSEFRHMLTIPLDHVPSQVIGTPTAVFATCPDGRTLVKIDVDKLTVSAKALFNGRIVSATATPDARRIVVAIDQPPMLCVVDVEHARIDQRIPLPVTPAAVDATDTMVAVVSADGDGLTRVSLAQGRVVGTTATGSKGGPVMFRKDGNALLLGQPAAKAIVTVDAASGTVVTRLSLPFPPMWFAVNADGGQVFVSGSPDDAIAIVNTYQMEVDQTIIGGRTPRGMAVAPNRNLLLLANPPSGDVTVLDIETRKLAASVHVGGEPGQILVTPDEEYALVFNDSGDVAVFRMQTVLDKKNKTKPLFTMFSTGAAPQSAVIVPVPA